MCLLLLALDEVPGCPVVLAANRDEFHQRPAEALHWQPGPPRMAAGRDLRAGGTWLGVRPDGRFAAVLNAPERPAPAAARSRGELVGRFLGASDPEAAAAAIAADAGAYAGFHFVGGMPGAGWYVGPASGAPSSLGAGLHGVDNAGLDPADPRLSRARGRFTGAAARGEPQALLDLLGDPADPGPGPGDRRPVFIRGGEFGTRCSTALCIDAEGRARLIERRYGADGDCLGDTELVWATGARASGS